MVLLVTVKVPVFAHAAAAAVSSAGEIIRDGAIGHGEGAGSSPPRRRRRRRSRRRELPEMVLLVMVKVPVFATPPPSASYKPPA